MDTVDVSGYISTDLMAFDVRAKDWRDLVRQLSGMAEAEGRVTPGYADDVIAREELYPTGLPIEGLGVAVPHAMTREHVVGPAIVYARLAEPVSFKEMGDGERDVLVEAAFLLVPGDAGGHLEILQKLILMLTDGEAIERLRAATTPKEVEDLLSRKLGDE